MPSPNNVLTADSYIQDGLVFQLDGIDYGGIDGQWIDRKSGIIAILNNLVTRYNDKHFYFDRGGQALFNKGAALNRTSYTIDFVGTCNPSIASVFCPFPNLAANEISLASYVGNAAFGYGRRTLIKAFRGNIGILCTHFQDSRFVNKGIVVTPTTNFQTIAVSEQFGINAAYRDSYSGRIFTIRCYNRNLSDREILINQKIDNARFGLGLDIPDEVLPASRSLSLLEPFELPDESESEQEPTNDNSDER